MSAKPMRLLATLACLLAGQALADGLVVVAHPSVPKPDLATLQRIYTGKVIEINSVHVIPYNAPVGSTDRGRFLHEYLQQDEDKYTAYWTVRRYIGKGTPPQEIASAAELARAIQSTPGAIGYLPEADLKPGMTVLFRRPASP